MIEQSVTAGKAIEAAEGSVTREALDRFQWILTGG